MKVRTFAAIAAMCAAPLFFGAGNTGAVTVSQDVGPCIESPDHGTQACYDYGIDAIQARDIKKDGHRATAPWRTDYGREGICENTKGYGEQGTQETCNYNFAEGNHQICFRAQTREGSKPISTSELKCEPT